MGPFVMMPGQSSVYQQQPGPKVSTEFSEMAENDNMMTTDRQSSPESLLSVSSFSSPFTDPLSAPESSPALKDGDDWDELYYGDFWPGKTFAAMLDSGLLQQPPMGNTSNSAVNPMDLSTTFTEGGGLFGGVESFNENQPLFQNNNSPLFPTQSMPAQTMIRAPFAAQPSQLQQTNLVPAPQPGQQTQLAQHNHQAEPAQPTNTRTLRNNTVASSNAPVTAPVTAPATAPNSRKRKSSSVEPTDDAESYRSSASPPPRTRRALSKPSAPSNNKDNKDKDAPSSPAGKKTAHNQIEKRYRNNLNYKMWELRDAVPSLRALVSRQKLEQGEDEGGVDDNDELELGGLEPAHKLNKATILSKATEYIHHLEKTSKGHEEEIRRLHDQCNALRLMISSQGAGPVATWS